MKNKEFKVGDRVRIIKPWGQKAEIGRTGVIRVIENNELTRILLCWDEEHDQHYHKEQWVNSLVYTNCWWYDGEEENFELIEKRKPVDGDKIVFVGVGGEIGPHYCFNIGDILEVIDVSGNSLYLCKSLKSGEVASFSLKREWEFYKEDDMNNVENNVVTPKSLLKNMMRVKFRDGKTAIFLEKPDGWKSDSDNLGCFAYSGGVSCNLKSLTEDLIHTNYCELFSIDAIYAGPTKSVDVLNPNAFGKLIWERESEEAKQKRLKKEAIEQEIAKAQEALNKAQQKLKEME